MPKKVILIFRKPHPNVFSIEYLFNEISAGLAKARVPLSIVTLQRMSTGLINRLLNTLSLLKYRKDIIHVTGDVHYVLLGAVLSKRILTIHDLGFLKGRGGLAFNILKLFWVSLPCRFAHLITVVSSATRDEVLEQVSINPKKIRVIYNFIDDIYQKGFTRNSFNNQQPRILQIGTAFNKNIPRLLEALKGLPCHLVFVGQLSKEYTSLLEDYRISYETRYQISNEELREEYIKADFLAYVSTLEGFGMPILEAQSCGLPVLTSNCSSMPEVAAKAAIFVDPFEVSSIRAGIWEMIDNDSLRKSLVHDGYENIKRFSKEKVTEAYLQAYKDLGLDYQPE